MITKQQAIDLDLREIHYFNPQIKQTAGLVTCHKWRRNGKTKIWKTKLENFRVPIKFGLYEHGYLHEQNAANFYLPKDCPNKENHK